MKTKRTMDESWWTENGLSSANYLICLAGDGALDRIAVGAIKHKIPIILAPIGFGNLFGREFGYKPEVDFIVHLLKEGKTINVDIGMRTEQPTGRQRIFLSPASYGFLEEVRKFAESGKRPRRRLMRVLWYVFSAGRFLLSAHPMMPLSISIDGEILTQEGNVALVSNVPAYAGHLTLTPRADPTDGKFDVCVISAKSKWTLMLSLISLWLTGSTHGGIAYGTGTQIEISGQPIADTPLPKGRYNARFSQPWSDTLTVLPRAMAIIVPRTYTRI